jgi:hypothetical protein
MGRPPHPHAATTSACRVSEEGLLELAASMARVRYGALRSPSEDVERP